MRSSRFMLAATVVLALIAPVTASAQAVENSFRSRLTSAAFQPPAPIFKGDGDVTATLNGRTATIAGDYRALGSPVTKIRVLSGSQPGVPGGVAVADLTAPGGVAGTIAGELKLTTAQVAQLKAGRLYVQVETQGAPGGALWGWLMPNYRFVGQNVPEKQNWYVQ